MTYANNFGRPVYEPKLKTKALKVVKIDHHFFPYFDAKGTKMFTGTVAVQISNAITANVDINLLITSKKGDDYDALELKRSNTELIMSFAMYEKIYAIALQHQEVSSVN